MAPQDGGGLGVLCGVFRRRGGRRLHRRGGRRIAAVACGHERAEKGQRGREGQACRWPRARWNVLHGVLLEKGPLITPAPRACGALGSCRLSRLPQRCCARRRRASAAKAARAPRSGGEDLQRSVSAWRLGPRIAPQVDRKAPVERPRVTLATQGTSPPTAGKWTRLRLATCKGVELRGTQTSGKAGS
jgi:hypothetical protein